MKQDEVAYILESIGLEQIISDTAQPLEYFLMILNDLGYIDLSIYTEEE